MGDVVGDKKKGQTEIANDLATLLQVPLYLDIIFCNNHMFELSVARDHHRPRIPAAPSRKHAEHARSTVFSLPANSTDPILFFLL